MGCWVEWSGLGRMGEKRMSNVKLDEPVSIIEKYLYGINIRLDAIVSMLSSLIETYAKQNNVAITNNKVEVKTPKKTRSKK